MYRAARDDRQRKSVEELAERFARHDRDAWRHGGPFIQDLITSKIAELDDGSLAGCAQLATLMMRKTLSSSVSGETFQSASIIFHSGSVPPGNALERVRRLAIEQLKRIHRLAPLTEGGDAALSAMAEAGSTPNRAGYSDELGVMIMSDLAEVVHYYDEILPEMNLERRRIEIRMFRIFHSYHRVPDDMAGNPALMEAQKELLAAIDECRRKLEENEDYRRYRTLVGHDSVSPRMWQTASYVFEDDGAERSALTAALAGDVHAESAGEWLARLERYVSFESSDLAAFMQLQDFIRLVAVAQPYVVLAWIDGASPRLSSWLPAMLRGLVEAGRGETVDEIVSSRIEAKSRLSELAWYLQRAERFDVEILAALLRKAIEADDDDAVVNAAFAAVWQFSIHPDGLVEKVFLPAVRHLNAKGNRRWVGAGLFTWRRQKILEGISETEAIGLLDAMKDLPRLGSRGEELLGGIAIHHPGPALDFIGWRFNNRSDDGMRYEAMPDGISCLKDALASYPEQLVRAARDWHAAKADMFQYTGGRIVAETFPEFGPPVDEILKAELTEGDRGSIAFVLTVLSAYEGKFLIHPMLRDIVDILSEGDKLLEKVNRIVQATGLLTGEHGSVDALKERQEAMGEWKADHRPKVQAFADEFIRGTANSIAWEKRRADQSQAQRRLQWGG
jgi:hypothetical protein